MVPLYHHSLLCPPSVRDVTQPSRARSPGRTPPLESIDGRRGRRRWRRPASGTARAHLVLSLPCFRSPPPPPPPRRAVVRPFLVLVDLGVAMDRLPPHPGGCACAAIGVVSDLGEGFPARDPHGNHGLVRRARICEIDLSLLLDHSSSLPP